LRTLAALAADLWTAAAERVHRPGRFDLPQLTRLYEHVVGEGVVGRARLLASGRRREVLPPVMDQLREAAGAAERLAADAPDAAPALGRLSAASRDAVRAIESEAAPAVLPLEAEPRDVLETLVVQGLRLAEEDDPLRRADCCAEVADSLAQTIVASSGAADDQQMEELGGLLRKVQNQAVQGNLDRAAGADLDRDRQKEFDRVQNRAADVFAILEKTLQLAAPSARAGLARALEAALADEDEPKGPPNKGPPPGKDKHGKGKHGKGG
jgi:hypothetical protein